MDVLPVERKEDGRTGCRTEPSQGRTRGPTRHTAHAPCCPAPTGRFPPCPSWGPHPGHLQPGHLPPLPLRPSISSLNARCPPLSPHQLPRPTRAGSASACPSAREPAPSPLPRKPPRSAPGNPQLPRFPPMQIHGPASPTELFRLIVHSFHPAVHSFVRYLMSLYPAGDQSGCCSRATNKTRHGSCLQQPHTTQGLPPIRVLTRPHPARLPRSDELGLTQGGVARDTQGTSKGANAASDACT